MILYAALYHEDIKGLESFYWTLLTSKSKVSAVRQFGGFVVHCVGPSICRYHSYVGHLYHLRHRLIFHTMHHDLYLDVTCMWVT